MFIVKLRGLLAASLLFLLSFNAYAGVADLSGTFRYTINGSLVNIEVDRITNNDSGYTTGTIYLTLIMTTGPSVFDDGYIVAREAITFARNSSTGLIDYSGRLSPGEYFYNIDFVTPYDRPPARTYYVHLFVSEYPYLDTVLDSGTANNLFTVSRSSSGSSSGLDDGGTGSASYPLLGAILLLGLFRNRKRMARC